MTEGGDRYHVLHKQRLSARHRVLLISKYPELLKLQHKTAAAVVSKMKEVLARDGIPELVVADKLNVPFNSREFRGFTKDWGIQLITSSPAFAQSNWQAERCVQTLKRMLKKARDSCTDVHLTLLEYRNTPVAGTVLSPSQTLMRSKI